MENTKQIESFSAEDTHALGKKLGENAKPGDVYTLLGDLGVGKTVLTQGIADGLGIIRMSRTITGNWIYVNTLDTKS